jgi:hypothetical protein
MLEIAHNPLSAPGKSKDAVRTSEDLKDAYQSFEKYLFNFIIAPVSNTGGSIFKISLV